ncbi:MAG: diguanylate cyclase [Leptospiraceae bacterium]|nr:diguanylate cyclase [Leptospiraceae bacterium]
MFYLEEEIKNYFQVQKQVPSTTKEFVELFELALKSQKFAEGSSSYRERFLVAKLVLNSIYQFFFEYNSSEFDFGIELKKKAELKEHYFQHLKQHPRKSKEREIELRKFSEFTARNFLFYAYSFYYFDFEREILLFFVIPSNLDNSAKRFREIFELIRNTYLYEPTKQESNFVPLYTKFIRHLIKKISKYPYQKKAINGVIAIFKFEDLKIYSEKMGEQFTKHVLIEIAKIIRQNLKRNDILYNISRKIFIAYLPDCNEEVAHKRFENLFFRIEPLIIRFQISYHPINSKVISDIDSFERLLKE